MTRFEQRRATTTTHARPSAQAGGSYRRYRTDIGSFEKAMYGVGDMITFGYLDEAGAWVDSKIYGVDYDAQLAENRRFLGELSENSNAYFVGQLAGGFVPFMGWAGRGAGAARGLAAAGRSTRLTEGVGRLAAVGAAQGALYGSGSADADGLFSWERVRGAAMGGVVGGLGGLVLGTTIIPALRYGGNLIGVAIRRGRTPALNPRFIRRPTQEAVEETGQAIRRPAAKISDEADANGQLSFRWNDLNGAADDVLPEGAVITSRELLMDPNAARLAVVQRLSRMSSQQIQKLAKRLDAAESSGEVLSDPHYRSLLGIDVSDLNMDVDDIRRAAVNLEEATDEIMERAGLGRRTQREMFEEFKARMGETADEAELERAFKATADLHHHARVSHHQAMVASVQFVRAKEKYLSEVLNGNREARDAMAEELSKAIRIFAEARAIKSQLGRGLGIQSHREKLAFAEVKGDVIEIESQAAIRDRVNAALDKLGNDDFAALMSRLRSLDDVADVEEVLLNAERAQEFSLWRRTMNTVSAFIKSNSLTPATGIFNTVSFVLHDLFRNRAARAWAARNYEIAGKADEAMMLRFMNQVERQVYWTAMRRGLKALMQRVQWEFWSDVEKIAGIANPGGKAAIKASASKIAMVRSGYRAPALREQIDTGRLSFDPASFNARNAARRAEGGAFANIVYHLNKAGAVTANVVDAAGMAVGKFTVGALDDFGREFIRVKEVYALSARRAMAEGLQLKLPPEKLNDYVTKRSQELAELPPSEILQRVEEALVRGGPPGEELRFLASRDYVAEREAEKVLFLDSPTTEGGQAFSRFARWLDKKVGFNQVEGVLMTYIRTPTRIFERGFVHYTPWGGKAREVQDILARGGIDAELERARMELGGFIMGLGAMAAFSGLIKLTNGGYDNSSNLLGAPPNRVQIGDAYFELSRLDPFALTLAMGGFLGQAMASYQDAKGQYGTEDAFWTASNIAYLAVRDAILEKTYMTSFRDLLKAVSAEDGDGFVKGAGKMFVNAFTRAVPLSGYTRTINDTIRESAPEAVSAMDQLFRVAPGLGLRLPPRVNALGDPIEGRDFGMTYGSTGDVDEVTRQLAELEIDITNVNKADATGFALTAEELSELRMIRGREAVNSDGMTMKEALADLFADPWFQSLPTREAKREAVMEIMSDFNQEARAILEERNPRYAANREANRALSEYLFEGLTREEARRRATSDTLSVGLPEPDRLN